MGQTSVALVLFNFLLAGFSQGVLNENLNTNLPPGVTVVMQNVGVRTDYGLAERIYVDPGFVTAEIAFGNSTVSLGVAVTSREDVAVRVETTSPDLIVVGDPVIRIRAGARMSVALTAFNAHSGEIIFYNLNNEEVARVPYVVTQDNGVRQNVGMSVDLSGSLSANYNANFQGGWSLGVGLGYSTEDRSLTGRITGGYSW